MQRGFSNERLLVDMSKECHLFCALVSGNGNGNVQNCRQTDEATYFSFSENSSSVLSEYNFTSRRNTRLVTPVKFFRPPCRFDKHLHPFQLIIPVGTTQGRLNSGYTRSPKASLRFFIQPTAVQAIIKPTLAKWLTVVTIFWDAVFRSNQFVLKKESCLLRL
ncbi:hypothetical protein K439DRAFT_824237 [Ramaria rubella]|nr:hypothetical protein K439DRAFT_824237 [Ramaria rubella]